LRHINISLPVSSNCLSVEADAAMSIQGLRTRWGGIADGRFRPSGYFRVVQHENVFWLVDPDGGCFLSKGINSVRVDQDQIQNTNRIPYAEACARKYGSVISWRAAIADRLSQWGFNTLGAWSDEAVATAGSIPLALTPVLDLGMSYGCPNALEDNQARQEFPDVFEPAFENHVRGRARDLCGKRNQNRNILGWFLDNELCWGPDWRGADELLTLFLNFDLRSAGRNAVFAWLHDRYHNFAQFNSVWHTPTQSWEAFRQLKRVDPPYRRVPIYERDTANEEAANRADPRRSAFSGDCDAFAALVANRYFALTTTAIKAADTNHLILGSRFAYDPSPGVISAAARHSDIISFNCYDRDATALIERYVDSKNPCLIGEFSFRSVDSGLPNTNGAGPLVPTQAERAAAFRKYAITALQRPSVIGYHWFEHADQPAAGRFDGENSNFGTVTIDDRVYQELTKAMTSLNAQAEDLHAAAAVAHASA
jgi:hypothetical protein